MMEKQRVKILCISDLHLGSDDTQGVYGEIPNSRLGKELGTNRLSLLKKALKNRFESEKIDFLFFTGDYLTGSDSTDKKSKATDKFLAFLEEIEGMPELFTDSGHIRERIIIVPGNHDVFREQEDGLRDFKKRFDKYLHPFRKCSGGIMKYAPLYVFEEHKLIIACVSTVDHAATESEVITNAIQYLESLPAGSGNPGKNEIIDKLKRIKVKDIPTIPDKTKEVFIEKSIAMDAYAGYHRIMVSHHPLLSGAERGKVVKEYPNTIGGYELLDIALQKKYSLFIHGHTHEFSCLEFRDRVRKESLSAFQLGLPSFQSKDQAAPQIVMIELGEAVDDIKIELLRLDEVCQNFKEDNYILMRGEQAGRQAAAAGSILVDYEIEQLINQATVIHNADSARIEAASYDCALGREYKRASATNSYEWKSDALESSVDGPAEIKLSPQETVLIYTEEKFNIPEDMVMHASPMSSWARKGLRVEISYFVDPGFKGSFCFPVTNMSDKELSISSREPIMSVEFVRLFKSPKRGWQERHPDKVTERKDHADV